MNDMIIGDEVESGLSPKHELELKIIKIGSLADNLTERIRIHERRLAKLYRSEEQTTAKDRITRLTQRILESS